MAITETMMDLTPHWLQIRGRYADAHAALQWVARAIYERVEKTVPIPHMDEVDLTPGLELGFLASNDGKIGFSDSNIRHDYLVRHAVDLALSAWDDLETFANVIYEIDSCSIRLNVRPEIGNRVFLVLAYEHEKNIVSRIAEAAVWESAGGKRNRSFGCLYHLFCEVLPNLDFEPASLTDTLELILQSPIAVVFDQAIEKLAARSQNEADALYNEFVARSESPVSGLLANVLLGLAKFDLQEAHRRALALINTEQPILRRMGIAALGEFKYIDSGRHDLLRSTLERLEVFRTMPNIETDYVLVHAYGSLLNQAEEAADAFVELAACPDSVVQKHVASVLFRKANEAYNQPWYKKALLNLVQMRPLSTESLQRLDYCIAPYAKNDPETAFEIVEAVVIGRDYGTNREITELPEMLSSTFMGLYNTDCDALIAGTTHWFASNDQRLHLAARDVHHHFDTIPAFKRSNETTEAVDEEEVKSSVLTLSKKVLDTLDEQTVIHVLCRVMAYVTDACSLAALLLSALRREPHSLDIADFVTASLIEYLLYNYPRDTGEYLKSRVEGSDVTETELQVIQTALEYSDAYFKARHNLPRLKELYPRSQRVSRLQLAHWKQQAAMMQAAEQRSVFMSLVSKVPIKYGRGSFVEQKGTFTEPSMFGTFSHEMELPQGEFIDPLGQIYQRRRWKSAGLHSAEDEAQNEPDGEVDA